MHVLRRALILCLVPVLLAAGSTAVASAYEAPRGATFNKPRHFGTDADHYRILTTIERAINHTRPTAKDPHPVIMVTSFLLDRSIAVTDLIDACRRHVQVRVILDEDIDNRNSRRLIKALNSDNVKDTNGDGVADTKPKAGPCNRKLRTNRTTTDGTLQRGTTTLKRQLPYYPNRYRKPSMSVAAAIQSVQIVPGDTQVTWGKDGSYVKKCDGSCRGAGGNMHSKMYLFSHTGRSKNVVMESSSNLNRGGALLGWNDLFVMPNRPKSYKVYAAIHREMTRDTKAGDKKVEVVDGPYTSRFFPMRHASKRNDPTLRDLRRIGCSSAFGPTQVHVSMFYWKGYRGDYLLDKLLSLARQGCQVSVIYGAPSREIAGRLRTAAKAGLVTLYDSRWDFDEDGWNEIRTHAKYVLVKGAVDTNKSSYHVWTGSQNWVAGSLSKGDEISLNIATKAAYRRYIADWAMIRNNSRQIPAPAARR
jgi:hypothetical protein